MGWCGQCVSDCVAMVVVGTFLVVAVANVAVVVAMVMNVVAGAM